MPEEERILLKDHVWNTTPDGPEVGEADERSCIGGRRDPRNNGDVV
jgi:hypothetical protein